MHKSKAGESVVKTLKPKKRTVLEYFSSDQRATHFHYPIKRSRQKHSISTRPFPENSLIFNENYINCQLRKIDGFVKERKHFECNLETPTVVRGFSMKVAAKWHKVNSKLCTLIKVYVNFNAECKFQSWESSFCVKSSFHVEGIKFENWVLSLNQCWHFWIVLRSTRYSFRLLKLCNLSVYRKVDFWQMMGVLPKECFSKSSSRWILAGYQSVNDEISQKTQPMNLVLSKKLSILKFHQLSIVLRCCVCWYRIFMSQSDCAWNIWKTFQRDRNVSNFNWQLSQHNYRK